MKRFIIVLLVLLPWNSLQAELYQSVDTDGHITYSNVGSSGAKKINIDDDAPANNGRNNKKPPTIPHSKATKKPSPGWYPRVDNHTQKQRDSKRKMILAAELNTEQQALEKAKQDYQEAKNAAQSYASNGIKSANGLTKHQEKIKHIEAEMAVHARNIELLNKELSY